VKRRKKLAKHGKVKLHFPDGPVLHLQMPGRKRHHPLLQLQYHLCHLQLLDLPVFSATVFLSSASPSPVAPFPVQVITPVPAPVEPEPEPEVGYAAYAGQGTVAVVLYEYEVSHMAFFSKYFLEPPGSLKI